MFWMIAGSGGHCVILSGGVSRSRTRRADMRSMDGISYPYRGRSLDRLGMTQKSLPQGGTVDFCASKKTDEADK